MKLTLIVAAVLAVGVVGWCVQRVAAQEVPTPGADEAVLTGLVPAPVGTTVTIGYVDVATTEVVTCATATTTSDPEGSTDASVFVLLVERDCAEGRQDPRVCWEDVCIFLPSDDPRLPPEFPGGQVIDLGLLAARAPETPVTPETGGPEPTAPEAGGPEMDVPTAGAGPAGQSEWAYWLGGGLMSVGALAVASGALLRRQVGRLAVSDGGMDRAGVAGGGAGHEWPYWLGLMSVGVLALAGGALLRRRLGRG